MGKVSKYLLLLLVLTTAFFKPAIGQVASFKIAKLKYNGGGDWYANKTALPNLIQFCNSQYKMNISPEEDVVSVDSPNIFSYPYIYMTGHGNVIFSNSDVSNLRNYLLSGGFLHIDDNYGIDKHVRTEMKKVFPELEFVELPTSHPIYRQANTFHDGLPKIHLHDGKPAQGFGLIWEGRLICFYSYESDLGNGWEDAKIHNNPQEVRDKALRMGSNILSFALTNY